MHALRCWRLTTNQFVMAIAVPAKRQLARMSKLSLVAVIVVAPLGLIVVPKDRLLRATLIIESTLTCQIDLHRFCVLCGSLDHLLVVNCFKRNVVHGLYRPHGPEEEGQAGP